MKILHLDIETAPNLAYVWGLWKENIPTARIVNNGYVLSWAAQWEGSREVMFDSIHKSKPKMMLKRVHKLLDQADVVVHYNGKSFDIPTLNKEFITHGFNPPSPYKQIDLLQVVRETFRFPSNKLDYVLQTLKLGRKVRHPGFEMWVKCMAGDEKSWAIMERYNKRDVTETAKLYRRLRPWIKGHPNHAAYNGGGAKCPHCGSTKYHRRGYAVVRQRKYPRFQCQSAKCRAWFRGTKAISQITENAVIT